MWCITFPEHVTMKTMTKYSRSEQQTYAASLSMCVVELQSARFQWLLLLKQITLIIYFWHSGCGVTHPNGKSQIWSGYLRNGDKESTWTEVRGNIRRLEKTA